MFALVLLFAPAPAASCALFPVDAMVQIFPWAQPPTPLTKPVAASRGELVHVQALLTGSGGRVAVTAEANTLGDRMAVRQLGYANLNETYGASRPTGLYPAVLMPLAANSSTPPENRRAGMPRPPTVFWLSVRIPTDASPGVHAAKISVSGGGCAVDTKVEFFVSTFVMPQPGRRSQTTGAAFQVGGIARYQPDGEAVAPETAMNFFKSMGEQGVDAFIFWEHGGWDQMPWAPHYRFNKDMTDVTLNTSMLQQWWPRVLALTGPSTRWRMPFSDRVGGNTGVVPTNSTWSFVDYEGEAVQVPIFTGTAGEFNPTFERMFRALFSGVVKFLRSEGWEEHGSWVQVVDEPKWYDNTTLTNTIALMELYRSISPSVRVFQTRWPDSGSGKGFPESCRPLLDLVDEWCAHVIQWVGHGVPAEVVQVKADRKAAGKALLVTLYDNGVPIIEAPNERARFQALDVWRGNGTLDGTLSWYSVNTYVHDPWLNPFPGGRPKPKPAGYGCESPFPASLCMLDVCSHVHVLP